jgi:DNA-binding phage protein
MNALQAPSNVISLARANAGIIRAPDEHVLSLLEACAKQIESVATIEDAKQVVSAAEAIAAISKKVDIAKAVKKAAVRLLVDAEAKLGELLRALPKGGQPTKRDVLKGSGLNRRRASTAERLAVTPKSEIDRVIDEGASTLHGVTHKLGMQSNGYELRVQKAAAFALLAQEAVELLERSVREKKVPHAGTVASYSDWLRKLKTHGNAGQ